MSTTPMAAHLDRGLDLAHWTTTDLWLAAVALGSNLSQADIDTIRAGRRFVSQADYDLLAWALNEHFADLGMDHPMSGWAQLGQA
jgi:hypothetical protein